MPEWSTNSTVDIIAENGVSRGLLILFSYSIDASKIEGPHRELSSLLLTIFIGLGFAPGILHHLGRGVDWVVGIRVQYKRNLNISVQELFNPHAPTWNAATYRSLFIAAA